MRSVPTLGTMLLAVVILAATATGQAQQPAGADGSPAVRALLAVRDSVLRVRSEIARFRRDLPLAGAQTVVSRARRLSTACRALQATMQSAANDLRAASGAPSAVRRAADGMQARLRETKNVLDRECSVGLRPEGPGSWPDSLKAWGPFRTGNIEQGLIAYESAAVTFAKSANLDLPPKGH